MCKLTLKNILIFIIICFIFILGVKYFYIFQNKNKNENTFKNRKSLNIVPNELLDSYNNKEYLEGLSANPFRFYSNSYLPFETAVPAIDVLRANKNSIRPKYFNQYLEENTSPFA